MSAYSHVAYQIASVRARIAAAARRSGRDPDGITLVGVTKTKPAEAVAAAIAAGVTEIGESYVQEAAAKRCELRPSLEQAVRWHLLGHLQRNKVKIAVQLFDLIHSVDSLPLAEAIGEMARAAGKTQDILLQVHLGTEATKYGVPPQEALAVAAQVAALPGLALRGLMGIAPLGEEPRPYFRELRDLFAALPTPRRQTLSMGMTGDFEIAIEEGSTLVRIGTAIFGRREG